ncbi:hypothetical protein M9Y10_004013 [Tritrichomonas musculus]|uniref:Uncharacterized protein n=1 Tax=Tritrichomonas musculus TaxID=1915356 RepID=A0ABR2JQV1_9EUKA
MSKKGKLNLVFNINCKKQTREYLADIAESFMKFTGIVIHRTNSSCLNMARALEEAREEITNTIGNSMRMDSVKIFMVKMGHLSVPYISAKATIMQYERDQMVFIDKNVRKSMEDVIFKKINEILEGFSEPILGISMIE